MPSLQERLVRESSLARRAFRPAFARVLGSGLSADLAEAAFPAYAHPNPLIAGIFWGRLQRAFRLFPAHARTLLDFGCGSGVAAYAAARAGMHVDAIDLNLEPHRLVAGMIDFPSEIRFSTKPLEELARDSMRYDAIIALDVLEHVPDYTATLSSLLGLLAPNGALVVSLPTESRLYRLGRRLAGREFSGDYHMWKASDIEQGLRQLSIVDEGGNHPALLPLFRILRARRQQASASAAGL